MRENETRRSKDGLLKLLSERVLFEVIARMCVENNRTIPYLSNLNNL